MALPIWQCMHKKDQLAVEIHFFPLSSEEVAERSRNLRTLFLIGARRSAQQDEDCNQGVENPELTKALPLDSVEK